MKYSHYGYKHKRPSRIAAAKRAGMIRKNDFSHYDHNRFVMRHHNLSPSYRTAGAARTIAANSIQKLLQGAKRYKRIRTITGLRLAARAGRTKLSRLPEDIINKIAEFL